ncbi:MAG: hypothetical protein C7B43_18405, partial [Sulfobacillus benefaciens]
LSIQGLITHLMTKLQSSMLGSFVSSSLSSHVPHLGFAPFLALIGSIGWAIIIWRIYPDPAISSPQS